MENAKQITVIVPIRKFDEEVSTLLEKAVESVDKTLCDIIFVGPNDVLLNVKDKYEDVSLVVNNESTDVFSQINKAVLQCFTPYFTVLEYDDACLPTGWKLMPSEMDKNAITLSLVELKEKGVFKRFANEIMWDVAFVGENGVVGYITEDELKTFGDFNVTGAIIKTEDFMSLGRLNPEFKVLAWYEFLMRAAKQGKFIYVFPRVCYSHTIRREGSYMMVSKDEITREELTELLNKILPPTD